MTITSGERLWSSRQAGQLAATYVLPLRRPADVPDPDLDQYLARLTGWLDVIVVDGSPPAVFAAHAARWRALDLDHVAPHEQCLNGKVAGVLSGLARARHSRVVLADDDVRYDAGTLAAVVGMLDDAELVRPQNYFSPLPWHARWDTGRALLNRALGGDYPGTLALRGEALPDGYRGDVLFENLELMRTVRAHGGRIRNAPECHVMRRPPTARHFWSQRVRQAYDDFAQPARLGIALGLGPAMAVLAARRRGGALLLAGLASVLVAETGRRRGGGRCVFPASSAAFAPVWLIERAVCSWLALGHRIRRGGCPYAGTVIRRAASPLRELRRAASASAGA